MYNVSLTTSYFPAQTNAEIHDITVGGLRQEWWNSKSEVTRGIEGAAWFVAGKGRSGDFKDI